MSIIDDAAAVARQRKPGPICRLHRFLERHPDEADEIRQLLASPAYQHIYSSTIGQLLRERGGDITDEMIARTRRGLCATCDPALAPYRDGS